MSRPGAFLLALTLALVIHTATCELCDDAETKNGLKVCQIVRVRPPPPPVEEPTSRRRKNIRAIAKTTTGNTLSGCSGGRCVAVNVLDEDGDYMDEIERILFPGIVQVPQPKTHHDISNLENGAIKKPVNLSKFHSNVVLGPKITNDAISPVVKSMSENMVGDDTFRGMIMAHGGTGSGKTHTLGFHAGAKDGLLHEISRVLFEPEGAQYKVHVFEIASDTIRDLSNTWSTKSGKVHASEIHVDSRQNSAFDKGLKTVNTAEDMIRMISTAAGIRATDSTNFNSVSSRSHMFVEIIKAYGTSSGAFSASSMITIVDFAGNEDATRSGGRDTGVAINQDLMEVKRCMTGSIKGATKLCKFLEAYKSVTSELDLRLMLTVSPLVNDLRHTRMTLEFGAELSGTPAVEVTIEEMTPEVLAEKEQRGLEKAIGGGEEEPPSEEERPPVVENSTTIDDDVVPAMGPAMDPSGENDSSGLDKGSREVVATPAAVDDAALQQCRADLESATMRHKDAIAQLTRRVASCEAMKEDSSASVEVICAMLNAAKTHSAMRDLTLPSACK